ncbi:MAG: chemotaxis protein CheD [Planctomycetes bacterium]|nr:chemotaxis protein CheD [Planctomycetota bacterium]MBL7145944.1 chemotaxis protein CheD [Phycisphaerae bacterium]
MEKIVNVSTGQVKIGRKGEILKSTAIGSCVVIAAYDSGKKIGVMAHVMLPGRAPKNGYGESTRYAADALDQMIRIITAQGANLCDLGICLVGAGNILKKKDDTICKDNIESITQLLKEKHIPVRAAVLGGTERKSISMDIESGSVYYTEGDREEKMLWKSTRGYCGYSSTR